MSIRDLNVSEYSTKPISFRYIAKDEIVIDTRLRKINETGKEHFQYQLFTLNLKDFNTNNDSYNILSRTEEHKKFDPFDPHFLAVYDWDLPYLQTTKLKDNIDEESGKKGLFVSFNTTSGNNFITVQTNSKFLATLKGSGRSEFYNLGVTFRSDVFLPSELTQGVFFNESDADKNILPYSDLTTFIALTNDKTDPLITEIDVSGNIRLNKFVANNNLLSSINLEKNLLLRELNLCFNKLTSIDLSKNTELDILNLTDNRLTVIDLEENTKLTELYLSSNSLSAIDINKNTNISVIDLTDNSLTSLDLSNNKLIENCFVANNKIKDLTLPLSPSSLMYLEINDNELTDVILYGTVLTTVELSRNKLTSLNTINATYLKHIFINENSQLDSIDVSNNTSLITLKANNCYLKELFLNQNTSLQTCECIDNNIFELKDLPSSLSTLKCGGNPLIALNLESASSLSNLDCSNCVNIKAVDLSPTPIIHFNGKNCSSLITLRPSSIPCDYDLRDTNLNKSSLETFFRNLPPVTTVPRTIKITQTTPPADTTDAVNKGYTVIES